ncbi:hypothetical protein LJC37_05515, partial [Bacteroidales bacterium OttesenSCG-928-E04]|nr:hypothetical protein [Bacteroidales bacterium OttesenSCG-928-E04]
YPLRVKYFIYRNVDWESLFLNFNINRYIEIPANREHDTANFTKEKIIYELSNADSIETLFNLFKDGIPTHNGNPQEEKSTIGTFRHSNYLGMDVVLDDGNCISAFNGNFSYEENSSFLGSSDNIINISQYTQDSENLLFFLDIAALWAKHSPENNLDFNKFYQSGEVRYLYLHNYGVGEIAKIKVIDAENTEIETIQNISSSIIRINPRGCKVKLYFSFGFTRFFRELGSLGGVMHNIVINSSEDLSFSLELIISNETIDYNKIYMFPDFFQEESIRQQTISSKYPFFLFDLTPNTINSENKILAHLCNRPTVTSSAYEFYHKNLYENDKFIFSSAHLKMTSDYLHGKVDNNIFEFSKMLFDNKPFYISRKRNSIPSSSNFPKYNIKVDADSESKEASIQNLSIYKAFGIKRQEYDTIIGNMSNYNECVGAKYCYAVLRPLSSEQNGFKLYSLSLIFLFPNKFLFTENIENFVVYTIDDTFYYTSGYAEEFNLATEGKDDIKFELYLPNDSEVRNFRFDWFRSNWKRNNPVGKLYESNDPDSDIVQDLNIWDKHFTPIKEEYEKLKNEYSSISLESQLIFIPKLTLHNGVEAKIHIDKDSNITDIYIPNTTKKKYDEYLEFAVIASEQPNVDDKIKIKCKNSFSDIKVIDIWAKVNGKKRKVGILHVHPNDTMFRPKIKLIGVQSYLPPHPDNQNPAVDINAEKNELNKFLQQLPVSSLIDNVISKSIPGSYMDDNSVLSLHIDKPNKVFKASKDFVTALDACLKEVSDPEWDDSHRIYFLNDDIVDENNTQTHLNYNKISVIGQNDRKCVPIHELLHSFGLNHIFSNSECSKNLYTFQGQTTQNIMDHRSNLSDPRTNTLHDWQIKVAEDYFLKDPSNR